MQDKIDMLVDNLGCSQAEALEIIEYDKQVDKMTVAQCESDLTAEQKAMAKKYRQGERKAPMVLNLPKKERKADTTKEGMIKQLYEFLVECGYADCEIINKSKLIGFKLGADTYELDLKRKRATKK
jgi:hypothetical protein